MDAHNVLLKLSSIIQVFLPGFHEHHTSTPLLYKILSVDSLAKDPHSVYIVQSDASGVDGFGYFHSYLHDTEVHYVSKRWDRSHAI